MKRIEWQEQTKNTCGQTCVAMIAGIPLADAIKAVGRPGGTRTVDLHRALTTLSFETEARLRRLPTGRVYPTPDQLPELCIVKIRWTGRHTGHWCVYAGGLYYDHGYGVCMPHTYGQVLMRDHGRITSYLPVSTRASPATAGPASLTKSS